MLDRRMGLCCAFADEMNEDMGEDMNDDDLAMCYKSVAKRYGTPALPMTSLISEHVQYRSRGIVTSDRCGDTKADIDFTRHPKECRSSCVNPSHWPLPSSPSSSFTCSVVRIVQDGVQRTARGECRTLCEYGQHHQNARTELSESA